MPDELKLFHYRVTGPREFPTNALTHDRCWPADVETATAIGTSWSQPIKRRTYRLIGLSEPTMRWWNALGFKVERA